MSHFASRSSSGLGLVILSHATGVRFPYGMPIFSCSKADLIPVKLLWQEYLERIWSGICMFRSNINDF